ncbi:phosphatidate cytidylyltransferase [Ponticoccus sp. SC2-23]|uniref:phosphatidate cytidylyltransferase n=1 Tax=Alexandriicola marinus TaxID=2081710 RepID=UPI000FD7C955|nr:phosphatidate cytidylyltransferase [Alexandriicola marinus]MBM1218920.1 phosphatidate cytidylyltransferase [Ponticoccus sp. SC6-9]MBM1224008.1 phosphatidate cytidylyltransferase [Ponticoccus sp. SC6-15]MBM1230213.1 phosphatidate cytidylyltransferase [Ponticoccus sp. SC6-38]MBM1232974.1 phosphatidate cytidylyltransferase [Ponticoccus sp. SC6-45]MBM1237076.1 phosphatidate cytidylyltransferase [Ponticoccus sp. SC6-49]MBM1241985.1 phosphatidate cytidylyltransferase [Ponticoccus sp. SC2-64]MBM
MQDQPSSEPARWGDLTTRIVSGLAIAVVGIAAIWAGGPWFEMLAIFVAGLMIWELWSMIDPDRPVPALILGVLTSTLVSGQLTIDTSPGLLLFLIVPAIGFALSRRMGLMFAIYALGIQLAAWGLASFRNELGLVWIVWIVGIVVISDVFGYFAGRTLGGPKFWPRISPKKTWSGTIAGWVGAACLAFIFMISTDAGPMLILLSVLTCFAGQMGDIAESALKRRVGVKDSSDLIPGHGGVLDRFDALLGATLFMLAVTVLSYFTGLSF